MSHLKYPMHSALFLILLLALALPQAGDCAFMDESSSRDFEEALRADNPHLRPKRPLPQTEGKGFGAVVTLIAENNSCRGTKLGPRLFLTAAHCAKASWENGALIRIVGSSVYNGYSGLILISNIHIFPGFDHVTSWRHLLGRGTPETDTDLALIEADMDTPGIPQAAVARSLPESVGHLIAFGHNCSWDAAADPSNKDYPHLSRVGITSINNLFINLNEQGCRGDSGSPLFLQNGEIIGVKSKAIAGLAPRMGYTRVGYIRLDTERVRAWLGQFLALSNAPGSSR